MSWFEITGVGLFLIDTSNSQWGISPCRSVHLTGYRIFGRPEASLKPVHGQDHAPFFPCWLALLLPFCLWLRATPHCHSTCCSGYHDCWHCFVPQSCCCCMFLLQLLPSLRQPCPARGPTQLSCHSQPSCFHACAMCCHCWCVLCLLNSQVAFTTAFLWLQFGCTPLPPPPPPSYIGSNPT